MNNGKITKLITMLMIVLTFTLISALGDSQLIDNDKLSDASKKGNVVYHYLSKYNKEINDLEDSYKDIDKEWDRDDCDDKDSNTCKETREDVAKEITKFLRSFGNFIEDIAYEQLDELKNSMVSEYEVSDYEKIVEDLEDVRKKGKDFSDDAKKIEIDKEDIDSFENTVIDKITELNKIIYEDYREGMYISNFKMLEIEYRTKLAILEELEDTYKDMERDLKSSNGNTNKLNDLLERFETASKKARDDSGEDLYDEVEDIIDRLENNIKEYDKDDNIYEEYMDANDNDFEDRLDPFEKQLKIFDEDYDEVLELVEKTNAEIKKIIEEVELQ